MVKISNITSLLVSPYIEITSIKKAWFLRPFFPKCQFCERLLRFSYLQDVLKNKIPSLKLYMCLKRGAIHATSHKRAKRRMRKKELNARKSLHEIKNFFCSFHFSHSICLSCPSSLKCENRCKKYKLNVEKEKRRRKNKKIKGIKADEKSREHWFLDGYSLH